MKIYSITSNYSDFSERTGIRGDFAELLWNGFILHSRAKNHTAVERFGADVPPIYSNARHIIVTDAIKEQLSQSNLQGFDFQEVEKQKIIKGDWLNFDESFFEKYQSPTYDPIEKGKHSAPTAEQMPTLWRLCPKQSIDFKKVGDGKFTFSIDEPSDFYIATGDRLGVFI
ncbi:hypothetical protein [Capnocytophaga sp.]|uniref:hypothetical protein n=1 Tax=Capnocytophaga sp. TaxID=44737 RepID=UPI0026DC128C|nr:hypothetical protein [Capnocytophaga sp.]MDO5106542.1 hypothetical protein [Capnocytophaga sp.]